MGHGTIPQDIRDDIPYIIVFVDITHCPSPESSLEVLSKDVTELIKRGWQPQGGIAMLTNINGHPRIYVQTMTRHKAI